MRFWPRRHRCAPALPLPVHEVDVNIDLNRRKKHRYRATWRVKAVSGLMYAPSLKDAMKPYIRELRNELKRMAADG